MSRLTKRISPIAWSGAPVASFTQGASAQVDLSIWLANPQGKAVTYAVVGTLPAGVTLTGKTLAYNGVAAASSASVTFTATAAGFTVTSPASTVSIAGAPANSPPVWNAGTPSTVSVLTTAAVDSLVIDLGPWVSDPENDPITVTASGLPTWLKLSGKQVLVASAPIAGQSAAVTFDATDTVILPSGDLPTLTVSSASGAWTFGQAFKQAAAPQHLTASGSAQVDVRNRWPDGSIKFAAISGVNASSVTFTASASPDARPALTTSALSGVTASIQFGAATASFSSADWGSPFRTITSGPVMSSWTYRKAIGADAHLVAWLEVRAYSNGQVEVLPWIENGYLNVASPTTKSGRAIFTLNGVTKYDSISDPNYTTGYSVVAVSAGVVSIFHHCRAVLVSGNTLSHWTSGSGLVPTHDRTYLQATKVVPGYRSVTINESKLAGLQYTKIYSPMRQTFGNSDEDGMGGTGGTPYISLLPESAAAYFCSGDVRAYQAVIGHGFSLGSYPIHYRDETTNRPLLFASYPTLNINSGTTPPLGSGSGYKYASSHSPAVPYVPYLLTAFNWFVEEMQFQVTDHYLGRFPSYRENAAYFFYPSAAGPDHNEQGGLRAQAWQWRAVGLAASATPDSDPIRTQFQTVLAYNATRWKIEHQTGVNPGAYDASQWRSHAPNPLGMPVEPGAILENGKWVTGGFQAAFFIGTLGLVSDLQVTGAAESDLTWFRDFCYGAVVGWLGQQNVLGEWNYQYGANYQLYIGPTATSWYGSWGIAFTNNSERRPGYPADNAGYSGTDLRSGNFPEASSYWGNMQAAISYAVEHGATGALNGYNRMVGASNWSSFLTGTTGLVASPRDAYKPRNVP